MGKTRQRLTTLFTIIGIVTTVLILGMALVITCTCVTRDKVPERTILELHLDRPLAEPGSDDPLELLTGDQGTTWLQIVEALERGAHDEHVVGVVAYIDGTPQGMARVEELRDAIAAFRAAGKPAIAFAETIGGAGSGNQGYYLATAFDEIYLQPTGELGLTGLRSERMFLRGTLDKLDVIPQGGRRSEYKSFYEMYVERHMSAPSREQTEVLLGDIHAQLIAAIAPRLGDDPARARAAIEQGPYLAKEALERGLVDGLAYRDEVLATIEERVGGDAERLYPGPYLERAGGAWAEGPVIALIQGHGPITRGPGGYDPIASESSMGAETMVTAFRAAIDDPEVQAIVFRVDSPGGSAIASDAVWHATQRAREAGKPVVVSMGNYAASGGYYVSSGATKIVAEPSTLTGSIGVLAVKLAVRGLWNKVGITWDFVQTSPNAATWSSLDVDGPEGVEQVERSLDRVYETFKQRVAEGRGLSAQAVERVARGRVWSGSRAQQEGLVDALGGLTTAIALAKQEAGIDEGTAIELRSFPPKKSMLAKLLEGGPDNSDEIAARDRVEASLERWRTVAGKLRAVVQASGEAGVLMTTPLEVH